MLKSLPLTPLTLYSSNASDAVAYSKLVESFLRETYSLYSRSHLRQEDLKFWQLEDDSNDDPLRLLKLVSTRWLCLEAVVSRVWKVRMPLVNSLASLFETHQIISARALLDTLLEYRFMGFLAFLVDVLKILANLSRMFQKTITDIRISQVAPAIRFCIAKVEDWYLNDDVPAGSPTFQSFIKEVQIISETQYSYHDLLLTRKPNDHENLMADIRLFCSCLRTNLLDRFSELPLLSSFSIFELGHLPSRHSNSLSSYGKEEIEMLAKFYGSDRIVNGRVFKRLVDPQELQTEWDWFKDWYHHQYGNSPTDTKKFWLSLDKVQFQYPNLAKLGKIYLLLPISSVDAERGFSAMGRIKTKLRNSMNNDLLNALMFISVNGPPLESYDAVKAVTRWHRLKKRRPC